MQTFGYVREIGFMKLPEPVILSLQNLDRLQLTRQFF